MIYPPPHPEQNDYIFSLWILVTFLPENVKEDMEEQLDVHGGTIFQIGNSVIYATFQNTHRWDCHHKFASADVIGWGKGETEECI